MINTRRAVWTGAVAVLACQSAAWLGARQRSCVSGAEPPAGGVWVDSLDLSKIGVRQAGRGGRGPGGVAPTTPPPPPTYALGGVTYEHTVPVTSDTDFTIDLKGA